MGASKSRISGIRVRFLLSRDGEGAPASLLSVGDSEFIMTIAGTEGSLPFLAFLYADPVVGVS
jgi:hypothetical protein